MTDQHPITPPPELLQKWWTEYWGDPKESISPEERYIATQAARWGADQELEASVEWLIRMQNPTWAAALQEVRRPKPKSLKEQALDALDEAVCMADYIPPESISTDQADIIRRALESLPE